MDQPSYWSEVKGLDIYYNADMEDNENNQGKCIEFCRYFVIFVQM